MRKLALMLAQCLLLAGCTGLPQPREMGEMALLRTVGVDAVPEGVRLTGSTGLRVSGVEGAEEEALIVTGEGRSLPAAAFALGQKRDKTVFFGYVDKLLLGEKPGNSADIFAWLAQDRELSLGADVWLLRDSSAAEAMEQGGKQGVEGRLSALKLDADLGRAPMTRTAGEIYSALLDRGCAFLPALRVEEELTSAGYGILKGEEIAGYLEGDAARGLELLAERPMAEILEVTLPENRVSLRVVGAQLDCRPVLSEPSDLRLELTIRVEGKGEQWQTPPDARERAEAERIAARALGSAAEAALEALTGWGTDCVGIGSRAAMAVPWYGNAMEENWPALFSAADYSIEVEVTLN